MTLLNNSINKQFVQLVIPEIANKIGLEKSIVLSQMHYWIKKSNKKINGNNWIYNTYEEWNKQFSYWSLSKIKRIFKSLEDDNLIISNKINAKKYDHTKWYVINHIRLKELTGVIFCTSNKDDEYNHVESFDLLKNSHSTDCHKKIKDKPNNRSTNNSSYDSLNLTSSYNIETKTTTKVSITKTFDPSSVRFHQVI